MRLARLGIIATLGLSLLLPGALAAGDEPEPGSAADPVVSQSYLEEAANKRLGGLAAELQAARQRLAELRATLELLEKQAR